MEYSLFQAIRMQQYRAAARSGHVLREPQMVLDTPDVPIPDGEGIQVQEIVTEPFGIASDQMPIEGRL